MFIELELVPLLRSCFFLLLHFQCFVRVIIFLNSRSGNSCCCPCFFLLVWGIIIFSQAWKNGKISKTKVFVQRYLRHEARISKIVKNVNNAKGCKWEAGQYLPTSSWRQSDLLWDATIIWLKMDFSFLRSVSCYWKWLFSYFWLVIPNSKERYNDSTKGVVVSTISSLMFSIFVFMEFRSCRYNSINLWYYCWSLSASRARFFLRRNVHRPLIDGLRHGLSFDLLSLTNDSLFLVNKI